MAEFLRDFATSSPKITIDMVEAEGDSLSFELLKNNMPTGIAFRGIPNGHEFTSLLLAILNADGKGKNLPDEGIARRVRALQGKICLQTYISLTCTNCPDVVQALNIFALLNPNIKHEMVDGALFQREVEAKGVQAVPSVFADGELLHVGRSSLGELLDKLESRYGSSSLSSDEHVGDAKHEFDVIVLGGGPAGASAAIYSARKGLKVAILAERIGGQVKETVGIENLISVPYTTGSELADNLRTHLTHYPIELFENRRIEHTELKGAEKLIRVKGGELFSAPAVIIATGAGWRRLNVEGESEYIGRGVAFCPHCDGPFYAGKRVAVVGGGNSGVEAAIDLAGICQRVTVVEFMDAYKIRKFLKKKLYSAGIAKIEIERRAADQIKVIIFTAKPGVVIGKGGADIENLKVELGKYTSKKLNLEIKEIKRPDSNAQLVAENIAQQLENRVSFRRAMKSTMSRSMKSGVKGIKTCVSGRLAGADIARSEHYIEGTIPLQTLRADIDYGFAEADTTYGKLGVKVWIYNGEVLPTKAGKKEGSDK